MKYLLLFLGIFLASCAVKQNLTVANTLKVGMTNDEVKKIMGDPVKSDFYKSYDEWHYCHTSTLSNEYIVLFFYDGKLIAKKNYTVLVDEEKGICGSCERFIRMGNYTEPDEVKEIRLR